MWNNKKRPRNQVDMENLDKNYGTEEEKERESESEQKRMEKIL